MSRFIQVTRFGGPEVLKLSQDLPAPPPGPGQIRVAVKAAAINRVDALYRSGAVRDRLPLRPPSGIGLDFAGVVEELGPGVSGVTTGTPVYGSARFEAMVEHVITTPDAVAV